MPPSEMRWNLPAERAGDRPPERGLPHAWRTDEAQDRILARRTDLLDREVLEDPLLDLLQPLVILVEDRPGGRDVDVVGRLLLPRHRHEPVDVRARDVYSAAAGGIFARRSSSRSASFLASSVMPAASIFSRSASISCVPVVGVAQLLLNRLHLLAQVVLALGLRHLRLGLGLDLRTRARGPRPLSSGPRRAFAGARRR
jgi:hypothetical protein